MDLRALFRRYRAWERDHHWLVTGISLLLLGYFVLGIATTGTWGVIDFPCFAPHPSSSAIEPGDPIFRNVDAPNNSTDGAVIHVSTYPARMDGGGCHAAYVATGDSFQHDQYTIHMGDDAVRVTTPDGQSTTLAATQTWQAAATADAPPSPAFTHTERTPVFGWPLVVKQTTFSIKSVTTVTTNQTAAPVGSLYVVAADRSSFERNMGVAVAAVGLFLYNIARFLHWVRRQQVRGTGVAGQAADSEDQ